MSHGLAAGHASGKSVMKWEGEKGRERIWYMWHIKMEMRLRRVHHINSLIGPVKAMDATLLRPHRMTSLMGWRQALPYNQTVQSPTSQTPVWGSSECFLFSSSIPALTLSPPLPDLYLISTDQIIFFTLPSQTAECVRQALDPFQHAVQFMRLLLQELDSFHFHPENSPHSGLEGRELSWRNAQRNMVKELF